MTDQVGRFFGQIFRRYSKKFNLAKDLQRNQGFMDKPDEEVSLVDL